MLKRCWLVLPFLAFLLAPYAGLAQVNVQTPSPCLQQACFWAQTTGTLAASASTTLTIQQPATAARAVRFIGAIVSCSGQSFSVDQSSNGTAATATAGTATALPPFQTTGAGVAITAAAKVWTASNVGSGTAAGPTLPYTAGDPRVIELSDRVMTAAGTANNYSVKLTNTGAASCTGTVAVYWAEKI